MLNKSSKKAVIKFNDKSEGYSLNSTSFPLKDGNLLKYICEAYSKYGELVIEYADLEGNIELSTRRSVDYNEEEDRIDEIAYLIRNYVRNRLITMEAYVVLEKGELRGVFGTESHADLKRKNLISRGSLEEDVVVKPIQVNSFHNFNS